MANKAKNIVTIVGARPHWMKIDPEIPQYIIHTGQHYDYEMSGIFFKELNLPKPDYNLNCKSDQTGKMMDKLRPLLRKLAPKLVLVYGDTNSTLAGALAAAYEKIPVAHIEAGLRCGRMDMPEEINRVVVDRISSFRLCPNAQTVDNLQWEGIRENVFNVGDPLFDAMNPFFPMKPTKDNGKYILLTIHREENENAERFGKIMASLITSTKLPIIWPRHPRMAKFNVTNQQVKIIKPVGYKEMLKLEANAKHIVTDSGGVQREAYWLGVPCSILRKETEWPEAVNTNWAFLVDDNHEKIWNSINHFDRKITGTPDVKFGAKKRIREILSQYI